MKLNKKIRAVLIAAAFLTVIIVCFQIFRERTVLGGISKIENILEEAKADQDIADEEDSDIFLMDSDEIQIRDAGKSADGSGSSANFCQSLDREYSGVEQKTAGSEFDLARERARSANKINMSRAQRDKDLSDSRKDQDMKIKEFYSKLEAEAKSGEEKQAVSDLKKMADGAILVFRSAVDKAIAGQRKGLEKILNSRKITVDQSLVGYKVGIRVSFGRAKDKCSENSDPEAARQRLLSDLKTVKDGFYSGNEAIKNAEEEIKALQKERKEALQKAANDLSLSIGQAGDLMAKSFPGRGFGDI